MNRDDCLLSFQTSPTSIDHPAANFVISFSPDSLFSPFPALNIDYVEDIAVNFVPPPSPYFAFSPLLMTFPPLLA